MRLCHDIFHGPPSSPTGLNSAPAHAVWRLLIEHTGPSEPLLEGMIQR